MALLDIVTPVQTIIKDTLMNNPVVFEVLLELMLVKLIGIVGKKGKIFLLRME
jgi:hypothetical protein